MCIIVNLELCSLTFLYMIYVSLYSEVMPLKGKRFGQERPPLSVTIKGILERYPDGQIFKVCVLYRHNR